MVYNKQTPWSYLDGPGRSVPQGTDGVTLYLFTDLVQHVNLSFLEVPSLCQKINKVFVAKIKKNSTSIQNKCILNIKFYSECRWSRWLTPLNFVQNQLVYEIHIKTWLNTRFLTKPFHDLGHPSNSFTTRGALEIVS